MSSSIEDYALIGDSRTAALVGADGSVDWLCLPRFDSPSCFAALVGTREHGRWKLAPMAPHVRTRRRYRPDTLILETELETDDGIVRLIDCMPPEDGVSRVLRVVQGVRGRVPMRMELIVRFGYGEQIPWVHRVGAALMATAGPHALELRSPVELKGRNFTTIAEFYVAEGEHVPFVLSYFPSHLAPPPAREWPSMLQQTQRWWTGWCNRCRYRGRWRDAVTRSLITLKALTYAPTGGIVAAPTMSLPERLGGVRNWDYRFCWLRDATFTLYALLLAGYTDEARAWREWLLRAAAGRPEDLQTLYGVMGEREVAERVITWLPGYRNSRPVRVGNAAAEQLQLDVYGEIMDALHLARNAGLEQEPSAWKLQRVLLDFLESHWEEPDNGIWEFRAERRHLTHSKVMAWVAVDRAVKAIERDRLPGPLERWRELRARIHRQVCEQGFDARRGCFVQAYASEQLDASLLIIPLVGFLPADDARVHGTLRAIESELLCDGLVMRYSTAHAKDGLPPGEGVFLPCSFWLADNLALTGQEKKAEALFERLLSLRNDVGLLSEEYDPAGKRMLGNFPQAFTHLSIVNTARNLLRPDGPAAHRSGAAGDRPPDGADA